MKKAIMAVILAALSVSAAADEYVNGYVRSDGTYVQPHYRSSQDSNRYNNYSTQGNVNPYTGQRGAENPYQPPAIQQYRPTYPQPYRTGR